MNWTLKGIVITLGSISRQTRFFTDWSPVPPQAIMSWLPKAEEKLSAMSPIAAVPRTVRIQIEELKVRPLTSWDEWTRKKVMLPRIFPIDRWEIARIFVAMKLSNCYEVYVFTQWYV